MKSNDEIDAEIAALTAEAARLQAEIDRLRGERDKARANVRVLPSGPSPSVNTPGMFLYESQEIGSVASIWPEECRREGIDPDYLVRCIEVVLPMADLLTRSAAAFKNERDYIVNHLTQRPQDYYTTRAAIDAGWIAEGER